jgi:osmotically-inducible protein OsmY
VTDLIVEKGLLFKDDTVVPAEKVATATPEVVELSTPKEELEEFPEYKERSYVAPPEGWSSEYLRPEYTLYRVTPGGMVAPVPVVPTIVHRVHKGVRPTSTVVERGHDVIGRDGKIGSVDHLLIDRVTGEIRLLVVDRGLLKDDVVIPAEDVDAVTEEQVSTSLSHEQVDDLWRYRPRNPVDVMTEVKHRMSRIPVDPESIDVSAEGSILRLSGVVPDMRTKRRIVATVLPVEGVLHVDDHLDTADTIRARVVAALRSHPATDIASIDVIARQGIVTLQGRVDDEGVKAAAGEIASRQPGVVEVINDLDVRDDEDSTYLRFAWLARTGLAKGTGSGAGLGTLRP